MSINFNIPRMVENIISSVSAEGAAARHFEKHAKNTGIQRIFEKLMITTTFGSIGLDKQAKQLEKEIDKWMPKTDSPERNKYIVMKAFTHLVRGGFSHPFEPYQYNLDSAETAVKLLKPIKLTAEGVYSYIAALQNCARIHMHGPNGQNSKAIQYLKEAEEIFETFKEKHPLDFNEKAVSFYEIFDSEMEDIDFLTTHFHTPMWLHMCYTEANNTEMMIKYTAPAVLARIFIETQSPMFLEIHHIVPKIAKDIQILIIKHHFPQVNHILSVLMFQLVKHRRSLPDQQKHEVNNGQAKVSQLFAGWAMSLVDYSLGWHEDQIAQERDFPINSNVIRLEKFVEPGVEIYEDQFPCEPLVTRDDFKKVLKKGKAWCQRAHDMYDDCPDGKFLAAITMKQIIKFQLLIDNHPDLP